MKKIKNFICNLGMILIHTVGILLIEVCCMTLLIDYHEYYNPFILIIPLFAGILIVHYLMLIYLRTHNILHRITTVILSFLDHFALAAVSIFLFFPNKILGTPMIGEYAFIFCVHILIVLLRYADLYRNRRN